jgi:hypothetical protein
MIDIAAPAGARGVASRGRRDLDHVLIALNIE